MANSRMKCNTRSKSLLASDRVSVPEVLPGLLLLAHWEEEQEFSILGVMELFSSDIQGYVERLLSDHPGNPLDDRAISHLRQLDAFSVNYFADWYFANLETYPQTQQYIEQLDYLRLLLIECLREGSSSIASNL